MVITIVIVVVVTIIIVVDDFVVDAECGGTNVIRCVALCVIQTVTQDAVTQYNAMIAIAHQQYISQPYFQLQ